MKKIISLIMIVNLVFISSIIFIPNKASADNNPVIDQYVTAKSVTKNKDGTITIKYKVKKGFSPGHSITSVNISAGYSWPSKYRIGSHHNYYKAIKNKKGTYSMTIPKPKLKVIGTQQVQFKLSAGRYSPSKFLKNVFNYPTGTTIKRFEITKSSAISEYIYVTGIGYAIKLFPGGKITTAAASGWLMTYTGSGLGVVKGFPPKVAGQYYQVKTYYNSKGLNVQTKIWSSKKSYKKKETPIYNKTRVSKW